MLTWYFRSFLPFDLHLNLTLILQMMKTIQDDQSESYQELKHCLHPLFLSFPLPLPLDQPIS